MHADAEAWKQALPLMIIFLLIIFSPLVYDLILVVGQSAGWE